MTHARISQCKRHGGFAAIAAIFLVVILAALGGFMLTFSNTQQLTSAQDLQGSRAYWAARAGLEWGIGTVSLVNDPSTIAPANCSNPALANINGFSVNVICSIGVYPEAGVNKYIFRFTSVASPAGGVVGSVGYIERSLSASMERCTGCPL